MKRAGSDIPYLQIKFDTNRQRCVANLTGFLQTNALSFLSLGTRKNLDLP